MILGQISYIDCAVFLVFLTPALVLNVGLLTTARWVIGALPHLIFQLPYQLVVERFFTAKNDRSPFVQRATIFQDVVIRCVRYAFANMPAYIGRVFFSKPVSLPFLRFRMLRHGYLKSSIPWREIKREDFQGIWLTHDENEKPDIVVYYCHGGGFSMGSGYFYMEFLMAWVTLLKGAGFNNPALFALEYTLVPDAVFPTQLHQTAAGYGHVLSVVEDPSHICVGGDSAGATLILNMLLFLSKDYRYKDKLPGLAALISPWVVLQSEKNRNTRSDYLDADSLELYGGQYAGPKASIDDPAISPGKCRDPMQWTRASPRYGWLFLFGSEEVLGPETRELITLLKKTGAYVHVNEEQGGIHAWPVATLYLGETGDERLKGLRDIVDVMKEKMLR